MAVEAIQSSSFDRFFQEVENVTVDFIRIDREIEAFWHEPTTETFSKLAAKAVLPLTSIAAGSILGVAFGIYILAANILIGALLEIGIQDHKDLIQDLPKINEYFPKTNGLRNIALGLAAWFPLKFLEGALVALAEKIFVLLGLPLGGAQDVGLLLSSGGLSGLIWILFGCVVAPVGEEIFFRGHLQDLLKDGENPSSWNRFVTALKTNAVFGAFHMSPFQGWFNIPVFAFTFLFGMCMSLLKELTGDLWAPMTCHMASNMIATAVLRC